MQPEGEKGRTPREPQTPCRKDEKQKMRILPLQRSTVVAAEQHTIDGEIESHFG
jgi:hypothetical protein